MHAYLLFIFSLLLSQSRIGHVQMLDIGTSLLSKLKAEPTTPEITGLIARLQNILDLYSDGLHKWQGNKSRTKGKVDMFSKLVISIPIIIDSFRTEVKTAMPGNKNVLIVLFGKAISIFYLGSQADIILAFKNLSALLNDYPLLADLKVKVDAFVLKLNAAYDSKANIKYNVKIDSDTINKLHSRLGNIILGTFGALLNIHNENPFEVERFFDSSVMRNNKKDPEKTKVNEAWVDVPVGLTVNASNTKIIKNGYLVFANKTDAPVVVYTASTADAPVPKGAFTIPEFGKVGAKVNDLGSSLNTFLLFRVKEGEKPGRIKVSWRNKK